MQDRVRSYVRSLTHFGGKRQMAKKYCMGLDIGTSSVGWTVTDECNHILHKGRKALIGSRIFEEAESEANRRQYRIARRRLNRRQRRIDLLQRQFAEEMAKVDPLFFVRLNNSFLHKEDKDPRLMEESDIARHDALFAGIRGLSDKDFHKNYPTIHHLIDHLMKSPQKEDIRLVYLAMHYLIKYRGNFLHEGLSGGVNDTEEVRNAFAKLEECLGEIYPVDSEEGYRNVFTSKIDDFIALVKERHGKRELQAEFAEKFKIQNSYLKDVVYPLLAGSKVTYKKIFSNLEDEEITLEDEKAAIELDKDNFSLEQLPNLAQVQGDTSARYQMVYLCKIIRDFEITKRLLGNSHSLSEAMIQRYEDHKRDLKWLKDWIRNHFKDNYREIHDKVFRKQKDDKVCNYARYVGKDGNRRLKRCDYDEFISFLKKEVFSVGYHEIDENGVQIKYENDPEIQKNFLSKVDGGLEEFLPKQNSHLNGVFPYQFSLDELHQIIEHQGKYYPFLYESYTTKDGNIVNKIESILKWHIPYFVGPLNPFHPQAKNVWAQLFSEVKKGEPIYPWSMEDQIDYDASAEQFILRMIGKCTYYEGANALPRYSLLYTRYLTVNWLNGCALDGNPIPWDMDPETTHSIGRKQIIEEYFKKQNHPTIKGLNSFLKEKLGNNPKITYASGKEIDDRQMPSMAPWKAFEVEIKEGKIEEVEEILKDLAIFEDKETLKKRLKKAYKIEDEKKRTAIASLNFKKFGRLSREFLELKTDKSYCEINEFGEVVQLSLLEIMELTGQTMMEVLNDFKYGFQDKLNDIRREKLGQFSSDKEMVLKYIDGLYISPIVKRSLLQAYKIVEEVERILKAPMDEFYVECTRGPEPEKKGKLTKTRYELVDSFLKEASKKDKELEDDEKDSTRRYAGFLEDTKQKLEKEEIEKGAYRSDKIYLYFMQLGRSMYSLEPLNIHRVITDDDYCEIDHIVPQSLLKDDSLDNRVLVLSSENQRKKAHYPVPHEILSPKAYAFYRYLKKIGLLSAKKYAKLVRTTPLTDEEKVGFINRQLTTTNQAVIGFINLIKTFKKRKDGSIPKVCYSKASLVSEFRQHFDFLKCRDVNDLHHAYDAYLNIIVGRTMWAYFPERAAILRGLKEINEEEKEEAEINPEEAKKQKTNVFIKVFCQLPERFGRKKAPIYDKDGFIVWNYEESLKEISKNLYERQGMVNVTVRTYCDTAIFKEISLHPSIEVKKDESNMFPIKKGLSPKKYGGYKKPKSAFFSIIREQKKNEIRVRLIPIRTMDAPTQNLEDITEAAKKDCETQKTKLIRVEVPVVKVKSVFEIGKARVQLTGFNDPTRCIAHSLIQLRFNKEQYRAIRAIKRIFDEAKRLNGDKEVTEHNLLEEKLSNKYVFDLSNTTMIKVSGSFKRHTHPIEITNDELIDLYDEYTKKLTSSLFNKLPEKYPPFKLGLNLVEKRDSFINMDMINKCLVLREIMSLATPRISLDDFELKTLGLGKGGRFVLPSYLPIGTKLIHQSITGFYEKIVWENKEDK